MNSSCITPDNCIVYMKRLENNGRVYPYYYSIWFDVDKDDYDFCMYGRSGKECFLNKHRGEFYQINIDGRRVCVNKNLTIRTPKVTRKENNVCKEVSEQMYQREALWWKDFYSINRNTYTDLTDTLCHPSLK